MSFISPNSRRKVTVAKQVLLDKLRENRAIHAAEYEEAVAEYLARLEADLKLALRRVKKEDFTTLQNLCVAPVAPTSHLSEFDEVIEMLEYSTSDEIEVDEISFKAYIQNKWGWSNNFASTKASYAEVGSFLR